MMVWLLSFETSMYDDPFIHNFLNHPNEMVGCLSYQIAWKGRLGVFSRGGNGMDRDFSSLPTISR
jgi:hypothetical protein